MALLTCHDCGHHEYTPKEKWYKCPACQKLVGASETTCQSCGRYVPAGEFQRQDTEKARKYQAEKSRGIIITVALFIIIGVVGLYFIGAFASPKPEPVPTQATKQARGTKGEAFVIAKKFVTKDLKAPGTAKFADVLDSNIVEVDPVTFIVFSYVDSRNSFGAMIRTHYRAKVMYLGNLEWKLLDLQTE